MIGNGGEIFVFDMGNSVKIADFVKRLIGLLGATYVEIKYTGLRDGEKFYEKLLNKEEKTSLFHTRRLSLLQFAN